MELSVAGQLQVFLRIAPCLVGEGTGVVAGVVAADVTGVVAADVAGVVTGVVIGVLAGVGVGIRVSHADLLSIFVVCNVGYVAPFSPSVFVAWC